MAGLRGVIGGLLRGAGLEALSFANILLEGVSENRRVPLVDDVDKPGVAGLGFDSSGENPSGKTTRRTMTTTKTTTTTPGTNAAIARKIKRAESALDAAVERLKTAIDELRSGSSMSSPGDIGRAATEVEMRRGILYGLLDAAET